LGAAAVREREELDEGEDIDDCSGIWFAKEAVGVAVRDSSQLAADKISGDAGFLNPSNCLLVEPMNHKCHIGNSKGAKHTSIPKDSFKLKVERLLHFFFATITGVDFDESNVVLLQNFYSSLGVNFVL